MAEQTTVSKRCVMLGRKGERWVAESAKRLLRDGVYYAFHDVTLRNPWGTQIDHVFVSVFGVFVVETKNWSGWIFGRPDDARWTQRFIDGERNSLPNPLRQNDKHTTALAAACGLPGPVVRSVVALVGEADVKRPMPANVTGGEGFATYIKSFKTPVLPQDEVNRVRAILGESRRPPARATRN